MRYVQGLGKKAKQALESAWSTGGPFTSVEDVCLRSGLNRKALQILARAGAFESFLPGRRLALWEILAQARSNQDLPLLKALATLQNAPADKVNQTDNHQGEQSKRAKAAPAAGPTDRLNLPPLTPLEETVADYSTMGLSADKHPMTFYRDWATTRGIISCSELSKRSDGEYITVAGGVICRQRPGTAKGFVFLTLEDETGMANVVIRPQLFESHKRVILNSDFMSITGKLQLEQGVVNVIAEDATTLPYLSGQPSLPARDFH